jgi:formate--tetrahydrofolate ligase
MLSSLEIAQAAVMRPIADVAAEVGIEPDELELFGRYKAKVDLSLLDRLAGAPDAKLINVTAITPTPAGEGKTTTSVALTQGFGRIGRRAILALREPSLGPVFGVKGGAAGAGHAQVVPMEDLNLHFTGDLHAITAANNLLAAFIDAHVMHGNELDIDVHTIGWRRALDMNDRGLRNIVSGLGGATNGFPRETGFDITAASEVMAILALASDLADLRKRLGAITVAYNRSGEPVTAEQIRCAGSMAVLLKDALKPNLVQTLEGQPAFVHCGPFANIAHGNSSLVADRVALKIADYVITESGFGADMGMEKFMDIVCRQGNIRPSAVVLVATIKALKLHGGATDTSSEDGLALVERGAANMVRHLEVVRGFGMPCVVAVNRFPADTDQEVELVRKIALDHGAVAAEINSAVTDGGDGAADLARAVVAAANSPSTFTYTYPNEMSLKEKIEAIAV